jgi:hypothetical protein
VVVPVPQHRTVTPPAAPAGKAAKVATAGPALRCVGGEPPPPAGLVPFSCDDL